MGDFYDHDGGFSEMTRDQMDAAAVNRRGFLWATSHGYACPVASGERHGYATVVVGTGGNGNQGSIVLTARSKRAAELLALGRILADVDGGMDHDAAVKLEGVAGGVRYGREEGVRAAAAELYAGLPPDAWNGGRAGTRRWAERWLPDHPVLHGGMTVPRFEAACRLAARMLGIDVVAAR